MSESLDFSDRRLSGANDVEERAFRSIVDRRKERRDGDLCTKG